ncbi:MAG: MBL fold metallo-hydrolase [Phycisphaerales bacterium]|nr:MBL fold metallo-hydrolase [Phycisphaerales bacterium]
MLVSRRDFVRAAAGTVLIAPGLAAAWQPEGAAGGKGGEGTWFAWRGVAPGAHVAIGEGGNSTLLIAGGHALLVDTKYAPFGATLRREAGALGAAPTLVVNTHHHADHTAGNSAFTGDLPVIAHENAAPRILAQTDRYRQMLRAGVAAVSGATGKPPAAIDRVTREARARADAEPGLTPQSWAPTKTVGAEDALDVGGVKVAVHHFGPGHTDNDLVLHVPSLNLLIAGDLLFSGLHPFMDPPGGATSRGWIESLTKAIALCDDKTVVVPGHGEVSDVAGLRGQIGYFENTRAAVAEAIAAGRTREQAQAIDLPEYAAYGLRDLAQKRALGAIYDEIRAGR